MTLERVAKGGQGLGQTGLGKGRGHSGHPGPQSPAPSLIPQIMLRSGPNWIAVSSLLCFWRIFRSAYYGQALTCRLGTET